MRNGVVESLHLGHLAVADVAGRVLAALGDADRSTYVRSAAKPFQALEVLSATEAAAAPLDDSALAIACSSHDGSDDQQIEAARLLADAGLDETALRCPPAIPRDPDTAWSQRWPYPLSHNCSGKHAGFLLASVLAGDDPAQYLAPDAPLQQRVRDHLAQACDASPEGPGVDGCGAPAWRLPLASLATGFARLAAGATPALARVRDAMTNRPLLVGGPGAVDTELMRTIPGLVAKRGAEAVFGAGLRRDGVVLGVAVKVTDGGTRADGPVVGAMLAGLGLPVPQEIVRPPVLGGGTVQGALEVDAAVRGVASDL